jgi:diguanylate cyclase (GGDEF)-like protein
MHDAHVGAPPGVPVAREPRLVPVRPVLRAVNADAPEHAANGAPHRSGEDAVERIVRLLAAATDSAVAAYLVAGEDGRPRCACAFGAEPVAVESLTRAWRTTMSRQGLVTLLDLPDDDAQPSPGPGVRLRAGFFAGIKVRGPEPAGCGMVCIVDPDAHGLRATTRQHLLDAHALIEEELLLRRQADHDPLTGVLNRRGMDERMAREWRRAQRSGGSLCVLAIDLDHFKRFNDSHGHLHGDAALRAVADAMLRSFKRPGDLVGRIGGDEFLVCLPQTAGGDAMHLAQSLRQQVRAESPWCEGELTLSIGVAALADVASYAGDLLDLRAAADASLYQAKERGRDQVVRSQAFDLIRAIGAGVAARPRQ